MGLNLLAGVVVGALSTALILILHAAEVLRTPLGGQLLFFALAFHITGLIWALGRHRAIHGDAASFGRLFGAGLMVSLVAGAVLAFGSWVFTTSVDPTYLEWVKERSLEQMASIEDMPAEERQARLQQLEDLDPMGYAVQGMMGTLVTGFFLSLTVAAFLRIRVLRQSS